MSAIKFIKYHGVDKAREELKRIPQITVTHMTNDARMFVDANNPLLDEFQRSQIKDLICIDDLKRLVKGVDLINSVGGLTIAKKITFQKRLRNEKATHFLQHPENQKLIQLFVRNQSKPEAAIKFDLFEQAIADYEAIGGEHV